MPPESAVARTSPSISLAWIPPESVWHSTGPLMPRTSMPPESACARKRLSLGTSTSRRIEMPRSRDLLRTATRMLFPFCSMGGCASSSRMWLSTLPRVNQLSPAEQVDGMDVQKVFEAARRALDRIHDGGGPQFIECKTYRWGGHSMADPGTYRPAVEVKAYKAWDPISAAIREVEFRYPTQAELAEVGPDNIGHLTAHMVEAGHLAEAEIEKLKKEVQAVVEDAAQFALQRSEER